MDLAGDVVTEDLGNILASVCSGDMSGMADLAENSQVNDYVRSAALKGMVTLAAVGERTREEVMDYFARLFRGRLRRARAYIYTSLVSRSVDLYPGEVYGDIEQAYADDLVESFMCRWEDLQEAHAMSKQAALERLTGRYHLITDTVAAMSSWACFEKEAKKPQGRLATPGAWRPRHPVRPAVPKVGRNDPCPCGSGKKHKKCCGT